MEWVLVIGLEELFWFLDLGGDKSLCVKNDCELSWAESRAEHSCVCPSLKLTGVHMEKICPNPLPVFFTLFYF